MKLLMENWRSFLKEDINYFGKTFVEFKRRVDAGEHPLKVAEELLVSLGKGSTRKVFGFPDNDSHLLKVINVDIVGDEEYWDPSYRHPTTGFDRRHKTVSNENEADLKMQQRYPNVFPRTYEVADDFSWILAERVKPLTHDELFDILGLPDKMTFHKFAGMYKVISLAYKKLAPTSMYNEGSTRAMEPEEYERWRVTNWYPTHHQTLPMKVFRILPRSNAAPAWIKKQKSVSVKQPKHMQTLTCIRW